MSEHEELERASEGRRQSPLPCVVPWFASLAWVQLGLVCCLTAMLLILFLLLHWALPRGGRRKGSLSQDSKAGYSTSATTRGSLVRPKRPPPPGRRLSPPRSPPHHRSPYRHSSHRLPHHAIPPHRLPAQNSPPHTYSQDRASNFPIPSPPSPHDPVHRTTSSHSLRGTITSHCPHATDDHDPYTLTSSHAPPGTITSHCPHTTDDHDPSTSTSSHSPPGTITSHCPHATDGHVPHPTTFSHSPPGTITSHCPHAPNDPVPSTSSHSAPTTITSHCPHATASPDNDFTTTTTAAATSRFPSSTTTTSNDFSTTTTTTTASTSTNGPHESTADFPPPSMAVQDARNLQPTSHISHSSPSSKAAAGPEDNDKNGAMTTAVTLSGTSSSARHLSVSSASSEEGASSSISKLKSRVREMLTRVREIDARVLRRDEVSVVRQAARGEASPEG